MPSALIATQKRDRSEHWDSRGRRGLALLGRAQDSSAAQDAGVARHSSLNHGRAASYPEATGYIIPTMLAHSQKLKRVPKLASAPSSVSVYHSARVCR
jgi:hypothetical protein